MMASAGAEIGTDDPAAAERFFGDVLGWTVAHGDAKSWTVAHGDAKSWTVAHDDVKSSTVAHDDAKSTDPAYPIVTTGDADGLLGQPGRGDLLAPARPGGQPLSVFTPPLVGSPLVGSPLVSSR